MAGTVAIDIETISPELDDAGDVDFLNSREFEVFAVGVGHRLAPDERPEIDVLWRDGVDTGDEYELLARVAEYLHEHNFDTIITYNGTQFDLRHLRGRALVVGDEVGDWSLRDAVEHGLQRGKHRDLMHEVVRERGHPVAFEDAVDEIAGERPRSVAWRGEPVTNGRVPALGEQLLAHREGLSDMGAEGEQLRDVLDSYVRADVRPLFELYDVVRILISHP